jgi:flagellar motor switch protein FliN/FliY
MPLEQVLALRPGSVVELEGSQDEQVDLLVNGSVVARGEVVAVEGQYAIRILEILSRDPKLGSPRPSHEIHGA